MKVAPNTSFSFTVPENVRVLYIETISIFNGNKLTAYVGVKPLTTHIYGFGKKHMGGLCEFTCATHNGINLLGKPNLAAFIGIPLCISWSPEINKQTPTVTDY